MLNEAVVDQDELGDPRARQIFGATVGAAKPDPDDPPVELRRQVVCLNDPIEHFRQAE